MERAMIFDIQHASVVDGPGLRTTVFFKGCNMKCKWCHNPESQAYEKQVMFHKEKCTGCGRCKNISRSDINFICFNDAREVCGKEYSADEVLENVVSDKAFYDNSGGGVTFSGGECMLQIDFLTEILKKCKSAGLHTAVDTAGNVPWDYFEKILPYTDLFLYDIKAVDSEIHKNFTGVSNNLILNNLTGLFARTANIRIRIPIIPGVNDTTAETRNIKKFLSEYKPLEIELLPYHSMGEHKYDALNMKMTSFKTPPQSAIDKLKLSYEEITKKS